MQLAACSTFPILIQRAPHEAQLRTTVRHHGSTTAGYALVYTYSGICTRLEHSIRHCPVRPGSLNKCVREHSAHCFLWQQITAAHTLQKKWSRVLRREVRAPSVGEGNPSRSWSHAASRATLLHPDPAFKWPIGFLLLSDFSQLVTWDYKNHRPCQRAFSYVARKSFSNPNNIAPMAPYQP